MPAENSITITSHSEIIPVFENDAELLSEVAVKAYADHYRHYWLDNGEWYIERCFSVTNLRKELADEKNRFYLAAYENHPVGFLKTRPDNSLPMFENENAFEVERIYLMKDALGKGIGRTLMEFCFAQALDSGRDLVWLKAMDRSDVAIAFYEKLGFVICGTERLDFPVMKEDYRGMVVMKKRL